MNPPRHFYGSLDGLRGLCALLVALFHASWNSHVGNLVIVRNGWVFVDMFFVLSGFIMFQTYARDLGTPREAKSFLVKRFFRLYPLHMVTGLVFVGLQAGREFVLPAVGLAAPNGFFRQEGLGLNALLSIVLLQGLGLTEHIYVNVPSWSISTEFWTYLAFAAVCALTRSPARRVVTMAALGALSFAILLHVNRPRGLYTAAEFGFLRCVASFGLGGLVWAATNGGTRLQFVRSAPLYVCWGLIAYFALRMTRLDTAVNACLPLVFATIIFLLAKDERSRAPSSVVRALQHPVVSRLGTYSFSIYMVHTSVLVLFNFAIRRFASAPASATGKLNVPLWIGDAGSIAYALVLVLVAACTYNWVERPCREFGKALAAR